MIRQEGPIDLRQERHAPDCPNARRHGAGDDSIDARMPERSSCRDDVCHASEAERLSSVPMHAIEHSAAAGDDSAASSRASAVKEKSALRSSCETLKRSAVVTAGCGGDSSVFGPPAAAFGCAELAWDDEEGRRNQATASVCILREERGFKTNDSSSLRSVCVIRHSFEAGMQKLLRDI